MIFPQTPMLLIGNSLIPRKNIYELFKNVAEKNRTRYANYDLMPRINFILLGLISKILQKDSTQIYEESQDSLVKAILSNSLDFNNLEKRV